MHRFDYSFLENYTVRASILNKTASIYTLRAREEMRRQTLPSLFTALEKTARIASVKSSNAIEGIVTTDLRIQELVLQESTPQTHNEEEIAGYRDVLSSIHTAHHTIILDEQTIPAMHKLLYAKTGSPDAGHYKTENNVIMEYDCRGRKRIRFRPLPAEETKEAMDQMLCAYLEASANPEINPLLLIPCFILDFLCIHPFKDGNGRISRLLTLLLLYKNGFDAGKYISFEEQIDKNRIDYYEDLKLSSIGWHETKNDYSFFIENFVKTLNTCYLELDSRANLDNLQKQRKTERIEQYIFSSLTPVSKSDICEKLPDISVTTVEKTLGILVRSGQIIKTGTGRNTHYTRKPTNTLPAANHPHSQP